MNPIELAFSKLKALLRARAIRSVDALWKALGDLCDSFSPEECINYFLHDGYSSQHENALVTVLVEDHASAPRADAAEQEFFMGACPHPSLSGVNPG